MTTQDNKDIDDQQLAMFGFINRNGRMVPILKKQCEGEEACTNCRGYGTYGNPLCGAIYVCEPCDGTGRRKEPPAIVSAQRRDEVVQVLKRFPLGNLLTLLCCVSVAAAAVTAILKVIGILR